jgi:5'-nucleotidase (lipoprotein e(P4) family)
MPARSDESPPMATPSLSFPRLALATALTLALSACVTAGKPVADTPPPAPVAAQTVPAHDNLNAVLWQQGSMEYRLIAGEIYRDAAERLDQAIKNPDWDALPEGARTGTVRGLPMAVIVDVDETVLDNSIYQARLVASGAAYNEATWQAWVEERAATPVPGALQFAQYAARRDVTLFYVTNRVDTLRPATIENLRALGFPIKDEGQILGLGTVVDGCDAEGSEKGCRRQLVGRTHRVLMQIGDQLGDFVDIHDNSPAGREAVMKPYLAWVGERWFVLPNPTYGSWEPALFDNNWRQPEEARRERKRASLRVGTPAN